MLGEALRFSTLTIFYPIAVTLIVIQIASYLTVFVGPIPVIWLEVALVTVVGAGGLLLFFRRNLPKGNTLKINKQSEWIGAGAFVALVFAFGQTLLSLATF